MSLRSTVAIVAVALFGISLLWIGTDGLRAFTIETANRLAVEEEPRPVPDAELQDQDGETFTFADYGDEYVLVSFMYATCGDVCPLLEINLQEIYEGLPDDVLGEDVRLVSVSFDPETDTPDMLTQHADLYQADGEDWRVSRITDANLYDELLDTFEVTVIPNEYGGYEHNAGIHLINPEGELMQIFDYDKPEEVLDRLETII